MKTKKISFYFLIAFAILATFFLILTSSIVLPLVCVDNAYAEEEQAVVEEPANTETPVIVVEQPKEEEDDLATVFKNNILPYIVSAGSSVLVLLVTIAPLIKTRGQNKTLQGMYTVASKTIETYKQKLSELSEDGIINKIETVIIPGLQDFILNAVKQAVKDNVTDTTGDIEKINTEIDVLSAQITNLIKAATLTWADVDGVKELLTKSPTAEVLTDYLAKFKELKGQVEAQNADAISPINEVIKELEVYDNENE